MNSPTKPTAFLYLFRDPVGGPEPTIAQVDALLAWIDRLKSTGLLQGGGSLEASPACVVRGVGGARFTDGPFPEAKEIFAGFLQVAADDFAQAAVKAKGCPILRAGTSLEVRQISPVDGRMHPC